jgi:hypothetical protein
VLTGQGVALGLRHPLDHCHGGRADLLEYPCVPALELLGGEVGLVVLRIRGGTGQRQAESERHNESGLHSGSFSV